MLLARRMFDLVRLLDFSNVGSNPIGGRFLGLLDFLFLTESFRVLMLFDFFDSLLPLLPWYEFLVDASVAILIYCSSSISCDEERLSGLLSMDYCLCFLLLYLSSMSVLLKAGFK